MGLAAKGAWPNDAVVVLDGGRIHFILRHGEAASESLGRDCPYHTGMFIVHGIAQGKALMDGKG